MTELEQENIYKIFLEHLDCFKKKELITLLMRGVSMEHAFSRVNLDPEYNTLDQFAERLFFFGEKSKYFWKQKFSREIEFNDISTGIFTCIFNFLGEIAKKKECNAGTFNYRAKNHTTFEYFSTVNNLGEFVRKTGSLDDLTKRQLKNYYLKIIHQLKETNYIKSSLFISSTLNKETARKFSNNEIIINFWDLNINEFEPTFLELPMFKGKPYEYQEETSIIGVIFPHYIHSFEYDKNYFYNPALFTGTDYDNMILGGFIIDQTEFACKMHTNTSYKTGLADDGSQQNEIS